MRILLFLLSCCDVVRALTNWVRRISDISTRLDQFHVREAAFRIEKAMACGLSEVTIR